MGPEAIYVKALLKTTTNSEFAMRLLNEVENGLDSSAYHFSYEYFNLQALDETFRAKHISDFIKRRLNDQDFIPEYLFLLARWTKDGMLTESHLNLICKRFSLIEAAVYAKFGPLAMVKAVIFNERTIFSMEMKVKVLKTLLPQKYILGAFVDRHSSMFHEVTWTLQEMMKTPELKSYLEHFDVAVLKSIIYQVERNLETIVKLRSIKVGKGTSYAIQDGLEAVTKAYRNVIHRIIGFDLPFAEIVRAANSIIVNYNTLLNITDSMRYGEHPQNMPTFEFIIVSFNLLMCVATDPSFRMVVAVEKDFWAKVTKCLNRFASVYSFASTASNHITTHLKNKSKEETNSVLTAFESDLGPTTSTINLTSFFDMVGWETISQERWERFLNTMITRTFASTESAKKTGVFDLQEGFKYVRNDFSFRTGKKQYANTMVFSILYQMQVFYHLPSKFVNLILDKITDYPQSVDLADLDVINFFIAILEQLFNCAGDDSQMCPCFKAAFGVAESYSYAKLTALLEDRAIRICKILEKRPDMMTIFLESTEEEFGDRVATFTDLLKVNAGDYIRQSPLLK